MKYNAVRLLWGAFVMAIALTGCASNQAQLHAAGDLGRASAGITLQDQPAACGVNTPHASLTTGTEVRSILKRERAQLDAANGKRFDCYLFNKVQIDGMRSTN